MIEEMLTDFLLQFDTLFTLNLLLSVFLNWTLLFYTIFKLVVTQHLHVAIFFWIAKALTWFFQQFIEIMIETLEYCTSISTLPLLLLTPSLLSIIFDLLSHLAWLRCIEADDQFAVVVEMSSILKITRLTFLQVVVKMIV